MMAGRRGFLISMADSFVLALSSIIPCQGVFRQILREFYVAGFLAIFALPGRPRADTLQRINISQT